VADLGGIVKAYDVRGVVPDEWDVPQARALGAAFAVVSGARVEDGGPGSVVLGRDMRPSSIPLGDAFAAGAAEQGVDVVDIGLASTDQLYFASGHLGLPGAMFTASHNPQQYNGIKMCRASAAPIGQDTGLAQIRDLAEQGLPPAGAAGSVSQRDVLADYAAHLHGLVGLTSARPLKIVIDAGNGMAGLTAPAVFESLPFAITELFYELDGTFPNHEANPIDPENLVDLQKAVLANDADLGLAFDGDADRCFVVDERGEPVSPSVITALIAQRELHREPGAVVIHNLITSRTVPEVIVENGGTPVRTRVGHSFIKAEMARTDAVFGGEHSGHFYFRDFWRADSGMLAALHVLAALAQAPEGTTLSSLLTAYERYAASGEINSVVEDQQAATKLVRDAFASRAGVATDDLDGLTVSGDTWWFNVRPSNTEPLLRLNAEARDAATMEALRDEVLALVRGTTGSA
jgi:phosphomannomutase